MTPQRQAYFNKCSHRENFMRVQIKEAKCVIKGCKSMLNREPKPYFLTHGQVKHALDAINEAKIIANAYRHELAKIKGMDNVVVPRDVTFKEYALSNIGYCSCGAVVIERGINGGIYDIYCRKCGKRILWEKVK